jgi:RNA polymerase sigma-70 factor (ECF subfamily)
MIQSSVSIEATIQRAGDGDQAAWETIVRTYWRKVFNVAYRFVGTYEEAEDLTQEIFLKVFRSLSTFDQRANFQTWLISVSRNYCIDRYRSGRRDREIFAREVNAADVQAEAPGNQPARARRTAGSRRPAARGAEGPVAPASHGRAVARYPRAVVPGNRQPARRGGRHGEVAYQPRTGGAGENR